MYAFIFYERQEERIAIYVESMWKYKSVNLLTRVYYMVMYWACFSKIS